MNTLRVLFAIGVAAIRGACRQVGDPIYASRGPMAYVRFVNAIPDSGAQDWRFVDLIEESPNVLNMPFRGIFPVPTWRCGS